MRNPCVRFAVLACVLVCALTGGRAWAEDEVQAVAQNMPGFKAQMQYQDLGNGESVNPDNGGLTVTHRSAIGLAGNMGSEVRPVRVYNSKLASDGFDDVNCQYLVDRPYGPLGFGWKISFGRVLMRHYRRDCSDPNSSAGYLYQDFFDYYYEDESGAQHHLFPLGGHTYNPSTHSPAPVWYVTNDGSYIRAKYQPSIAQWVLYFHDGSVRRAGDAAENGFVDPVLAYTPSTPEIPGHPVIRNPFSHGWYVTTIEDRARNVTAVRYTPYDATGQAGTPLAGSIDSIQDSFGRQIRFEYGAAETVADAPFLLRRIQQWSPYDTQDPIIREEEYSYGDDQGTVACGLETWPVLAKVVDPALLETLYRYGDTPPQFFLRPILTGIYYPTGAVSSYEHDKYMYLKLRFWHLMPRFEQSLDYAVMGLGVSRHTVESRVDPGSTTWNRLTWVWKRRMDAKPYLYTLDSSYDFPVHPVITVDPLGTEEVRYFSADDSSTSTVPPGSEILTVRRKPGSTPLDPVAIDALTDPRTQYNVWDQVISWTHKRYESGDFQGNTRLWGDSHRCKDVKWPLGDTTARLGNVRPYDIVQGEREVAGAEKWKKRSLSTEWSGFGEYRRTQVNDLSPQPSVETHFSGFRYDFPEDIPEFVPGTWTELPLTYQADLKTHSFSGAALAPGLGYQYRLVQYTRDADTGLVTGQRSYRDAQADPMHPVTSVSDKLLAITYTNTGNDKGNIASLTYSGGDSAATYGFAFTWQYGMVSQMSRDNSPYGAEFMREIDPDTSRIVSHEDANGLVTSFEYDALDRLTSIDPPGEEHGTYVSYPNDTSPAPGQTWTWVTSHDILFYRGPAGFTPQVDDTLTDLDAGAAYQHYFFDDLGRLVRTRSMHPSDSDNPSGYLTETLTSYDPLGKTFFTSLPYRVTPQPTFDAVDWATRLINRGVTGQTDDTFVSPVVMNPQAATSVYGSVSSVFSGAGLPENQGLGLAKYLLGDHELFDRPIWAFKPDDSRTKTTYSGLDTAATLFGIKSGETIDPNSESTTWYRKDILGRLRRVEPPLGTTAEYSYNGLDQLIQVNLTGQLRTFTYDALGRILTAQNPENGTTSYLGYDCIGNLLAVQDANGAAAQQPYTLVNEYDPLGRLTATRKVRASNGQVLQTLVENTYDRIDQVVQGASQGKLVKSLSHQDLSLVADAISEEMLSYDIATGRVASVTQSSSASGGTESYAVPLTYDLYGQVTDQILPDAKVFSNVYSHGAVIQRQVSGNPVLAALDYDVRGALRRVLFDTGESQETEFDAYGRPVGFAFTDVGESPLWGNGSFQNAQAPYTYDGAGNIASVGVSATQTDTFTYDALSRLTAAGVHRKGGLHQFSYTYDAYGNLTARNEAVPSGFQYGDLKSYLNTQLNLDPTEVEEYIQATVFSATVQGTSNRLGTVTRAANTGLTPPAPQAMTYDPNGNLTGDGKYLYGYDALNRQVSVTEVATGDLIAEYAYLASGERVAAWKFSGGQPSDYTRYFRDGAAVLWEQSDSVGHAKSYLYAGGRMAYTHEAWRSCIIPLDRTLSSLTLGTPTVTAPVGSETVTAEFSLPLLPAEAEAVEIRLVKGSSLVASQRFERPEGGWCGQERATFAGLPEGADYQAGLTVYLREGRAKLMPANAYLVERMKLGLVRGKLAAWTAARFKQEGDSVSEEATTGFASLAPEGAEDYTARAKKGAEVEEVARGQEASEVTLPDQATSVAIRGTTGSGVTLDSATLGLTKGGAFPRPTCTTLALRTYYGVDHLGTVRYTKTYDYNYNEIATSTHDYEPFGVELPGKDSCGNTHQFTGHERDQETGNDYMHFRMFASNMGRFMKPDDQYDKAEANPQGFNLYLYVKGNPVNLNDPTGHWGFNHRIVQALSMAIYGVSTTIIERACAANEAVDTNPATDPVKAWERGDRGTLEDSHAFAADGETPSQVRDRVYQDKAITPGMSPEEFGSFSHSRQDVDTHSLDSSKNGHAVRSATFQFPDAPQVHPEAARSALTDTIAQVGQWLEQAPSQTKLNAALELYDMYLNGEVGLTELNGSVGVAYVPGKGKSYDKARLLLQTISDPKEANDAKN